MPDKARVLIFIVSYNAEAFIESVLDRIPEHVWTNDHYDAEVLVIDDQSSDRTFQLAVNYMRSHPHRQITPLFNPKNQGYGGNQKLGYHYAISHGFDAVVLLHGDGQYAPELLDQMIMPLVRGEADMMLGSRMIRRLDAVRGGMPLYKWLGNQVLTWIQNRLLGTKLAEFHTGYRAYSTAALRRVPFEFNSNYYDFDTDIIIQMLDTGQRIQEIPIPTYYGDEISYVNGFRYGILILLTTLRSRIVQLSLLYDRRFDYGGTPNEIYTLKLGYPSSHQFALDRMRPGLRVLDVGCGPGDMTKELYDRQAAVISMDRYITPRTEQFSVQTVETEIEDYDLGKLGGEVDLVLLLDIIEHLRDPEEFMLRLRSRFAHQHAPEVILTTGNVAFFFVRFGLLLGNFNYGRKGILDRDHRRLFTFGTMDKLLRSTGYEIVHKRGIPAPYPVAIGDNWLSRLLLRINGLLLNPLTRSLFAYQMAYIARPLPYIEHLLELAQTASQQIIDGDGR